MVETILTKRPPLRRFFLLKPNQILKSEMKQKITCIAIVVKDYDEAIEYYTS